MLKSILKLTGINLITYVLNFFSAIILFWLYEPVDYALYASIIIPISTVFSLVINLRLDFAFVNIRPRRTEQILCLLLLINIIVVAILATGILIIKSAGLIVGKTSVIIISGLFLGSLFSSQSCANTIFAKNKEYISIGKLKIISAGLFCAFLLLPVDIDADIKIGLYHCLAALIAIFLTPFPKAFKKLKKYARIKSIRDSFQYIKHRQNVYPTRFLPAAILNGSLIFIIQPYILYRYGDEAAGNYAMCLRLYTIPMALVGAGISKSIMAHKDEIINGDPKSALKSIWKITIPLGVAMVLITFVLSKILNNEILGKWYGMHDMVLLVSVMTCCQLVASSISTIVYLKNRGDLQIRLDVFRTLIVILLIIYAQYSKILFNQWLLLMTLSLSALYIYSLHKYRLLFINKFIPSRKIFNEVID